jgi:hypothetical protein
MSGSLDTKARACNRKNWHFSESLEEAQELNSNASILESREEKNTKLSIYLIYALVIFGAFLILIVFNQLILHPQIDITNNPNSTAIIVGDNVVWAKISLQNVPAVINGITASTSIVIGFIGVVVGILVREIFKGESKAKIFLLLMAFLLTVPLTYLSTVYSFLLLGYVDWAIRWALNGLVLSLFIFVVIMLFAFHRLTSGKKAGLEKESSDEPKPDESKIADKNKNVNVFVNVNNQS